MVTEGQNKQKWAKKSRVSNSVRFERAAWLTGAQVECEFYHPLQPLQPLYPSISPSHHPSIPSIPPSFLGFGGFLHDCSKDSSSW